MCEGVSPTYRTQSTALTVLMPHEVPPAPVPALHPNFYDFLLTTRCSWLRLWFWLYLRPCLWICSAFSLPVWLATCVDRTCGICVTFQYPVAWFLFSYFLCWFCNVSGGSRRRERRGNSATLCPRPTTWRVASHKSNAKHCLLCCFEATLFRCFATFRPLSCLLSPA